MQVENSFLWKRNTCRGGKKIKMSECTLPCNNLVYYMFFFMIEYSASPRTQSVDVGVWTFDVFVKFVIFLLSKKSELTKTT